MRARFGAWYELFPRSWGGIKGVEAHRARARRARLRRALHAADPPDRRHQPQGPQQRAHRRPRTIPGSPYAIGGKEGGHDAVHPELGTRRGRPRPVRHRARARHGHRARLRDQRLGRPPVADRAPRVVPPPPRRHAQVRREPAQEVPGHLQRQLGVERLARRCGTQWLRHLPVLGRRGREGLPRRQPAHEAVRVLGVADRGGARGRPRRDLPGRGVHAPRGHARAGQARLHAVLHLLHLEELALGADRSTSPSSPRPRRRSTSGRTSSRSRRTSSHAYLVARRPGRVRTRGSSWPATLAPSYGIYSGYEHFENVPVREGSEEYLDSEKYEIRGARARRPAAADDRAASTRSGARTPRCRCSPTCTSSRRTTTR